MPIVISFAIICGIMVITSPPSCRLYGKIYRKIGKGLSHLSIKLQKKKFIKSTYINKCEEDCIICFDDYLQDSKCSELHCGHMFHNKCIVRWMDERKTCPLCNTGFVLKSGKIYNEDKEDSFYMQFEDQ